MRIVLSNHAKKRLIERGIKMRDVQEAIDIPDYTVSKGNKKEAYKTMNGKTIKIVYSQEDKYIKVVTLIWK